MHQEIFRICIGVLIILVHALCFCVIFLFKDAYLTRLQQLDTAFILMPVTAAYATAVIRSAIENKERQDYGPVVNLNYAIVVILFTALTLGGVLYNVIHLTGATPDDRRQIMLFEIAFGTGFGLIVTDLFGKADRVRTRLSKPTASERRS
jgi:hypothetical protein